jgi:hypothetical protein
LPSDAAGAVTAVREIWRPALLVNSTAGAGAVGDLMSILSVSVFDELLLVLKLRLDDAPVPSVAIVSIAAWTFGPPPEVSEL